MNYINPLHQKKNYEKIEKEIFHYMLKPINHFRTGTYSHGDAIVKLLMNNLLYRDTTTYFRVPKSAVKNQAVFFLLFYVQNEAHKLNDVT